MIVFNWRALGREALLRAMVYLLGGLLIGTILGQIANHHARVAEPPPACYCPPESK